MNQPMLSRTERGTYPLNASMTLIQSKRTLCQDPVSPFRLQVWSTVASGKDVESTSALDVSMRQPTVSVAMPRISSGFCNDISGFGQYSQAPVMLVSSESGIRLRSSRLALCQSRSPARPAPSARATHDLMASTACCQKCGCIPHSPRDP